ncbi:hypothetical protein AB833_02665 [Chromatiales bacterium (ex Bugula neritina AB1)]|nr:hypothetical protein AB833_02665 [Chromatiales bacterium (ex Bugula neritina AB1)]
MVGKIEVFEPGAVTLPAGLVLSAFAIAIAGNKTKMAVMAIVRANIETIDGKENMAISFSLCLAWIIHGIDSISLDL